MVIPGDLPDLQRHHPLHLRYLDQTLLAQVTLALSHKPMQFFFLVSDSKTVTTTWT